MASARGPPKQTPTNYPELKEVWATEFKELRKLGYSQAEIFRKIAKEYGVSPGAPRYHLISSSRSVQKKSPSHQWSVQKKDPQKRQRVIDYRLRYQKARRQIDLYVQSAFEKAEADELSLEQLVEGVAAASGVQFRPKTLLGLVATIETKTGEPLLQKNKKGGLYSLCYR